MIFFRDGLHISFYSNSTEEASNMIKLCPVLINVGINELAFTSYFLGKNDLQVFTIRQTYKALKLYFENSKFDLNSSKIN